MTVPRLALIVLAGAITTAGQQKQKSFEFNTLLMESTFRVEGRTSDGTTTIGTFFVVVRPYSDGSKARYTLVTANHVLDGIAANTATLVFRKKTPSGTWSKTPVEHRIRGEKGEPLWQRHPDADVAVMYLRVPNGVISDPIPMSWFADDAVLTEYEVHPGDRLYCLGYPFGFEANTMGFPILRSGQISSYPLLPTRLTRTFLFDFEVFGGNSGGPVYLVDNNRTYGGSTHIGILGFLVGLVSQQAFADHQTKTPYRVSLDRTPLGLANVVHASLIKETINRLPSPETVPD